MRPGRQYLEKLLPVIISRQFFLANHMTLFEECKAALKADFHIVEGEQEKAAIDILAGYLSPHGGVAWSEIDHAEHESLNALLSAGIVNNQQVFVLADDGDVPVFRTHLTLIAENIDDVTALCPVLYIFNEAIILQPLFTTGKIRAGNKPSPHR